MADSFTITGAGDITFGTTEVGYTTVGTIVSATRKKDGEILELKTRKGNTFVKIYFDEKDVIELEAIFDSTFTLPPRGTAIDIAGLTDVLIDDWELKWDNKSEKKISITCSKHQALVLDT